MENFFIADSDWIIFAQLIVASLLGMTLGLERSLIGKTAGMRTYGLVSLGACLLVAVSLLVVERYVGVSNFDPMRMAAAVVMGIGFLGGGLIFVQGGRSQGLTTAAGLWVAMGVGVTVGFRLYAIALATTLIALGIFTFMWRVEQHFKDLQRGSSASE